MRFELSEDQQEIQGAARELLTARSSFAQVRAAVEGGGAGAEAAVGMDAHLAAGGRGEDDGLWRELCELGWPGIAIAEAHGGQGLGLVELCVVAEELGRAVAPVPFLGTALAGLLVQHEGTPEQQEDWLVHLAAGSTRGAVTLTGDRVPVPGADEGALVVVADAGDGPTALYAPGSGIVDPVDAVDPTRGHGRVPIAGLSSAHELDGRGEWLGGRPAEDGDAAGASDAPIDPAAERPGAGSSPALTLADRRAGLDRAAIVVAAELVGVVQRALDMTVAYVKERRQFGVPVGSFQAVQHGAAQMLRDVTMARVLTYHAAWVADAAATTADPGDRARRQAELPGAAAMAKAAASDAGRSVTAAAIQLHGGIGFTWEADVHWLLKRAQVDAALLGGAGYHRRRIAGERRRGSTATGAGRRRSANPTR